MNIPILQQKVNDVLLIFKVSLEEMEGIEAQKKILESTGYTNSAREKRLNEREIVLFQREKEVNAQKTYIEDQNKKMQVILTKITTEKDALRELLQERLSLETERNMLAIERKQFDEKKKERDAYLMEKEAFEKERRIFAQEKLAMQESQKMLLLREGHIKAKEERIARIERLTNI